MSLPEATTLAIRLPTIEVIALVRRRSERLDGTPVARRPRRRRPFPRLASRPIG